LTEYIDGNISLQTFYGMIEMYLWARSYM
jgi:hypothetical protein